MLALVDLIQMENDRFALSSNKQQVFLKVVRTPFFPRRRAVNPPSRKYGGKHNLIVAYADLTRIGNTADLRVLE